MSAPHGIATGLIAALAFLTAAPLAAQDAEQDARTRALPIEGGIPDAPAFTFLGATPTRVSRPSTARNLAVALANGVDSTGRVQQGLAFDVAVWPYLRGISVTREQYQRSMFRYALYNTQLSIGSARTATDTGNTDFAVGVRTVLFDTSDPMADPTLSAQMEKGIEACNERMAPLGLALDALKDSLRACVTQVAVTNRRKWLDDHWNGNSFGLAAAAGERLPGSRFADARWRGFSVWGAGSLALAGSARVIYQLRYDNGADTAARHTELLRYGVRGVQGSPRFNGFFEWQWERQLHGDGRPAPHGQGSAGVEFLVSDQLWVSTGIGNAYEQATQKDRVVLIANFRWHVADRPRFTAGQ